jgi:hypothetical protein
MHCLCFSLFFVLFFFFFLLKIVVGRTIFCISFPMYQLLDSSMLILVVSWFNALCSSLAAHSGLLSDGVHIVM